MGMLTSRCQYLRQNKSIVLQTLVALLYIDVIETVHRVCRGA